jgi:two-component system, NarL family, sensor kinase
MDCIRGDALLRGHFVPVSFQQFFTYLLPEKLPVHLDTAQCIECDKELVLRNRIMATLSSEEVIGIIALGTMGMLILIGGIAAFILVYQKKMLEEQKKKALREIEYQSEMIRMQLQSQEAERKRIGADLHDSLGSLLWGAKVNAEFIERAVNLQGNVIDAYKELKLILDQSITTVRRISWELTPEAFHDSGFSQSVGKLCEQMDGKGIEVKFVEEAGRWWSDDDAMQAYRIVQELVSNAMKHANAKRIMVSLIWKEQELLITVQDDGIGFQLDHKIRQGVGWWNIEQRAKRLKAEISIGNTSMQQGSTIGLTIPLNHDTRKKV